MRLRRRVALVASALVAVGLFWLWMRPASATPTIESITTDAEYGVVTVVFGEGVSGSGTGTSDGAIVLGDVDAGSTLESVTHTADSDTVVLGFDGPVQPGAAITITIDDDAVPSFVTAVPVAVEDWAAIEASLRAIELPVADVPIAPSLVTETGAPRTLSEWLPGTTATSLDLPAPFSIARDDTDGSFTVSVDGSSPLLTTAVAPTVVLESAGGVPYGLDLTSASTIDLGISLAGTVELDDAGQATSAALSVDLAASATPTLAGGIGIVEATVASALDLDVSIGFDLDETTADTPVVTTAAAVLGDVTLAGLGAGDADLAVDGSSLLEITWPTLPTAETDTAAVTDDGWTTGGLQQLANVSINDLLGAPGGVASWLSAAQTQGTLATPLTIVPDTLGDSIGVAQSLAAVHDQVAVATAVAFGPLAATPAPHLSPDLCADLAPSAVRAAEVAEALETLGEGATTDQILGELPNVTVDAASITTRFTTACDFLFDSVVVDLANGTIESAVDIPEATFDFFGAEDPVVDLSYDAGGLGSLAVALETGTWTGTANPAVAFTLGLKLDSATDLVDHDLAVDLGEVDPDVTPTPPPVVPDAGDVTAAYRVYVPDGETLATSTVSVTGTDLAGFAQLGFLDLEVSGEVDITPAVTLGAEDPETGFDDGKADLLELLAAAAADPDGSTAIDDVLTVATAGDDVDAHFTLDNGVIESSAQIDVAGDVAGLIDDDVDHLETAIAGPDDVDAGTLAIGQTFGDTLELAAQSPAEVVSLVADMLDAVAGSEAVGAGDETIPLINVSLNEVSGLSGALGEAATALRERAPGSVTELETFVDDALTSNGLGGAVVAFAPAGADTGPELTIELDAGASEEGSYPVSFELSDGDDGVFNVAPTDGGSRLDAAVQIDFDPVLGLPAGRVGLACRRGLRRRPGAAVRLRPHRRRRGQRHRRAGGGVHHGHRLHR